MANGGIAIYNNNGVLQITDMFKNIQFVSKMDVRLDQPGGYSTFTYGQALSRGSYIGELGDLTDSFFAIRCNDGNNKFIAMEIGYGIATNTYNLYLYGEPNAKATIYKFSYANIPSGDHFEVRNAANDLVFSDKANFMKVIDSERGRISSWAAGQTIGITDHPSEIKTAVAQGLGAWNNDYDEYSRMGDACRQSYIFNSTTTVSTYEYMLYHRDPHNYYYERTQGNQYYQYMVIDVTGL